MEAGPRGPPPPPNTGGDQGKRAPFNLAQAHKHVPAAVVKLLRAQLTPLAEDTLPEPTDLGPFWEKTKRALLSLDQSFTEHELMLRCGPTAVQNLGPLIVGAMGWQQLKGRRVDDWPLFVRAVEDIFGLTR